MNYRGSCRKLLGNAKAAMMAAIEIYNKHPLRQMNVISTIGTLYDKRFTNHTFQAIAWKHDLKNKSQYCWRAKEGVLTKYSNDVVTFVQRLTRADIDATLTDYCTYLRSRTKKKTVNS